MATLDQIFQSGTLSARPAATAFNRYTYYWASDAGAGTLYQNQSGSAWTAIADVGLTQLGRVVTSGSQATISFASISAIYSSLLLVVNGRSAGTGSINNLVLNFNGDTGANYDYEEFYGHGSTVTADNVAGTTALISGYLVGASGAADRPGSVRIEIPDYAQTVFHKTVLGQTAAFSDPASLANAFVVQTAGAWRSTAAITSILLGLQPLGGGAAQNFVDGSTATLYGLP